MTLSATAYLEKNKLTSTKAWLVLLKITLTDDTEIFLVANTEQVTWPVTNGDIYLGFPFEIDEIGDTNKGEIPSVAIKVSNVTRSLEPYLEDYDGMVDSIVEIYVVNSTNVEIPSDPGAGVNNITPEIELRYEILRSHADSQWVTFTLGATNPFNKRFPRNKVSKNYCRYKEFKGDRCQYDGEQTSCDRSLDTCRIVMDNAINFGGCPGVATKGIYV